MGKKAGKVALGLGLITGALAGLFFAPEEGKKIRAKIAKGDGKGLLDDLMQMGEEIADTVREIADHPSVEVAIDKAKDKAADVADMKRSELDEMLKKANKKADEFKKQMKKYVDEQKKALDKAAPKKKKTTAKKKTTKKAAPKKKAVAKKAPAKKAPAKKTAAKKSTTKKTTTKKKK